PVMIRATLPAATLIALTAVALSAAAATPAVAKLSAAEIVDKNIAARGGLNAWRGVRTLSWAGKLDAGGNTQRSLKVPGMPTPPQSAKEPRAQMKLPFVMEMMRTRKSRLEIEFSGQTAVQVYDGTQGWKVRPFLNRHEVEPFTPAELEAA